MTGDGRLNAPIALAPSRVGDEATVLASKGINVQVAPAGACLDFHDVGEEHTDIASARTMASPSRASCCCATATRIASFSEKYSYNVPTLMPARSAIALVVRVAAPFCSRIVAPRITSAVSRERSCFGILLRKLRDYFFDHIAPPGVATTATPPPRPRLAILRIKR